DRLEDLHVAGAAAEIARQRLADLGQRRLRLLLQQRLRRQQESRRAVAALRGAEIGERLLQRMESLGSRHALDRFHTPALAFESEAEAGDNGLAADEHGAGPALAELAAVLRARQREVLAEHLEESLVGLERGCDGLSVDRDRDERLRRIRTRVFAA